MKVIKVFNHNVVLARDGDGKEVVVQGKGLGYNRRTGDDLDPAKIERRFLPAATTSTAQLAGLVAEIPIEHIVIAEDVLRLARARLSAPLDDRALIALADHISFALQRQGEPIDYPLASEVRLLYPREVSLGSAVLDLIESRSGIRLPALEAVPLAMHFVNAQVGVRPMGEMVRMTEMLRVVVSTIQTNLGLTIPEDSIELARLAAHLRYLFLDHARGGRRTLPVGDLATTFKTQDARIYDCARSIVELMAREMNWTIHEDETLYIALHIYRFANRSGAPNGADPSAA
ncbi:PRD domain-containing protein [Oryzibacter oryziterrae]|uniref:PRD domain-containing protein n=1 Tax=Oryzibacter oryziterrae TaxID=2766474 RepID=UPI001F029369|nr:PRD domain-containing protein [Oryzibacter oryziterrae]